MTVVETPGRPGLAPAAAWSLRVRKVGGYIQLAFAAFWLVRGGLSIHGRAGAALAVAGLVVSVLGLGYAIGAGRGVGQRPHGAEARRIERSVTVATVIELIASFALPAVVIAAGRSDWVLPSIAITIGPLLLWLDHVVSIRRLRLVGWILTIAPLVLIAVLSGPALAATTGLGAGLLLLLTALAGFRDLDAVGTAQRAAG